MRNKRQHEAMPDELLLAIGLVWGYFSARQYEEAYELATGCLQLWPQDQHLFLMASYAAAEVLEPVDRERLLSLRTPENAAWVDLVLRRLDIRAAPHLAAAPNANR